jgi:hypothetical protein
MNKQIVPVESIRPFFKWNVWSKDIMDSMGFEITRMVFSLTKEKWLTLSLDWTMPNEEYKVKYAKLVGTAYELGGGNDAVVVSLFFSEIEADPEAYRADYNDTERNYNGFGKVCFDAGIEIEENEAKKHEYPTLDYEYAYFVNTKYGVVIYFKPRDFGDTEKVLVKYKKEEKSS